MNEFLSFLEKMAETDVGTGLLIFAFVIVFGIFTIIIFMIRAFQRGQRASEASSKSFMALNTDQIKIIDRLVTQAERQAEVLNRLATAMVSQTQQNASIAAMLNSFTSTVRSDHERTFEMVEELADKQDQASAMIPPLGDALNSLRYLIEGLIETVGKLDNDETKKAIADLTQQAVGMRAMLEIIQARLTELEVIKDDKPKHDRVDQEDD